jgi:UDP-N-acetylmuramate dehydrogenase
LAHSPTAIVLSVVFRLEHGSPAVLQEKIDAYAAHRRRTQPPGASMGSMFKNPPGDYAGRLIESVGLKGMRMGDAEISALHANFFINRGQATASELFSLIRLAQTRVFEQTGINLELEIELIGEW